MSTAHKSRPSTSDSLAANCRAALARIRCLPGSNRLERPLLSGRAPAPRNTTQRSLTRQAHCITYTTKEKVKFYLS